MPYVIKRYSNRKLYDPQASRYVTLDEIRQFIRSGEEIHVEDATTGEDLTSLTLTQILLENERTHAALPSVLLHQLIRHGEAWYEFLNRALRTSSLDFLSGTPRDIAQFWTNWAAGAGWPTPRPEPAERASPPSPSNEPPPSMEDELAALKEQLASLEARLGDTEDGAHRTPPTRKKRRR